MNEQANQVVEPEVEALDASRKTDLVKEYIGPNADYYVHQFDLIGEHSFFRLTFNPFAALFGPVWYGMRSLWSWVLPFCILEVLAIVQVTRGLWGDLAAPYRERAEKIGKTLEQRRAQLESAIESNSDNIDSFRNSVKSLEGAVTNILEDGRIASEAGTNIMLVGLIALIGVKLIQGGLANWALERRFTEWRSNRTIRHGISVGSVVAICLFIPFVYGVSILHFTVPENFAVLSSFPVEKTFRIRSINIVKEWFDYITLAGEQVFTNITYGIRIILDALEVVFATSPWPVVYAMVVFLAWISAGTRVAIFAGAALAYLVVLGFWDKAMLTLALLGTAACFSIAYGIPLGVLCARKPKLFAFVRPLLDFMQSMPAFVYLIPVIAFFGTGKPAAIVATIIFGSPPVIRLTVLGLKSVPHTVREAALSFGATPSYMLFKVDLPLAMPSIMAGINQTIMLSLAMVVLASLIGAKGLGEEVLEALQYGSAGQGILAGLAILCCAMVLDRIVQGKT